MGRSPASLVLKIAFQFGRSHLKISRLCVAKTRLILKKVE